VWQSGNSNSLSGAPARGFGAFDEAAGFVIEPGLITVLAVFLGWPKEFHNKGVMVGGAGAVVKG
jgi:hypothetical protein